MYTLEELLEGLEKIAGDIPSDEEALNFYVELLKTQNKILEKAREKLREKKGDIVEKAREAVAKGDPAVAALGADWIDDELLADAFTEIGMLVQARRPDDAEAARAFLAALGSGAFTLRELAESVLQGRDDIMRGIAAGANIDAGLVQALVYWAMQPFMEALAELLEGKLDLERWNRGVCPVCGSHTRLGYMTGAGNALYLKCQVCGAEWRFPRVTCPFCGNNESGTVGFYTIDGDKRFRLYECKKCHHYWKVVDENVAGTLVPRKLYDVWTLKLDHIAREKGLL